MNCNYDFESSSMASPGGLLTNGKAKSSSAGIHHHHHHHNHQPQYLNLNLNRNSNFTNSLSSSPSYDTTSNTTNNARSLTPQMCMTQISQQPNFQHFEINNYNNNNNNSNGYQTPPNHYYNNHNQYFGVNSSKHLVPQIISLIKQLDIKLIAFDFDCTLVSIHTGGQWFDSAEKLAEFVRPCFRELLPALLQCNDLFVCVVTYSPQEHIIREVLRITMKNEAAVNEMIKRIVIKGNTKEFLDQHGIEHCYSNGKQKHLEYCRSYLREFANIDYKNVLLIDDDVQNVKIANANRHFAFQVDNNVKLDDLHNYLKTLARGNPV